MPFINGRFCMNPAYGRAIERARTANQIWSEEIPGPTGVSLREQSFGNDVSLSETHRKDSDAPIRFLMRRVCGIRHRR
jgi:hypothetical protein